MILSSAVDPIIGATCAATNFDKYNKCDSCNAERRMPGNKWRFGRDPCGFFVSGL
jgi:hypothetical protein